MWRAISWVLAFAAKSWIGTYVAIGVAFVFGVIASVIGGKNGLTWPYAVPLGIGFGFIALGGALAVIHMWVLPRFSNRDSIFGLSTFIGSSEYSIDLDDSKPAKSISGVASRTFVNEGSKYEQTLTFCSEGELIIDQFNMMDADILHQLNDVGYVDPDNYSTAIYMSLKALERWTADAQAFATHIAGKKAAAALKDQLDHPRIPLVGRDQTDDAARIVRLRANAETCLRWIVALSEEYDMQESAVRRAKWLETHDE